MPFPRHGWHLGNGRARTAGYCSRQQVGGLTRVGDHSCQTAEGGGEGSSPVAGPTSSLDGLGSPKLHEVCIAEVEVEGGEDLLKV